METKTCEWCGAPIDPSRNARFCDAQCYGAAYRQAKRIKKKLALPTRTCPVCGKDFIPTQARQVYCGKECYRKCKNANIKKKAEAVPKKPSAPADLNRTMLEIEAYNKAHGTCISYGQWMGGAR